MKLAVLAKIAPLLFLTAAVSCGYSPAPKSGALKCGTDTEKRCPSGYHCAGDDTCWRNGEAPLGSAPNSVLDGGGQTDGMASGGTGGSAGGGSGGGGATGGATGAGPDGGVDAAAGTSGGGTGGSAGAGGGGTGGATGGSGATGGTAGAAGGTGGGSGGATGGSGGSTGGSGGGGTGGTGGCTDACVPGAKKCGSGGKIQTCEKANATACAAWGPEVACQTEHQTCTGAAPDAICECLPAPSECMGKIGATCQSTSVLVSCTKDAAQCLYKASMTTCPPEKPCSGMPGMAGCSCPMAPAGCTAEGKFCSGNDLVTCAMEGGCFKESGRMTCSGGQTCTGQLPTATCAFPAGVWDQSSWDQALWQ